MADRLVVTGVLPNAALDVLRAHGDTWVHTAGQLDRAGLLAAAPGASALVTLLTDRVDDEVLDAAGPALRVVANVAVGFNNVDVAACHARGVVVTNTPDVLTDATADIAMALVLMATRRLGEAERVVRSGTPWRFGMGWMLGTTIQGRRLGIVGMGRIGTALARRARAHGMTIAYANRSPAPAAEAELGATRCTLDELLATSDVVSLHCPYGPATHHLVDAGGLARMKPTAFLVNTSRGPVVDEAALAAALAAGTIAGAGLDVYEHEPEVHPGLVALENVVLLPHVGSATVETRTAMAVLAARNAVEVLAGRPALTPVP